MDANVQVSDIDKALLIIGLDWLKNKNKYIVSNVMIDNNSPRVKKLIEEGEQKLKELGISEDDNEIVEKVKTEVMTMIKESY